MGFCFLSGAAFFPRLTLLISFLMGAIPDNPTPFLVDVIAAMIAPRLLIAYWLYVGGHSWWLVGLFIWLWIANLGGTSSVSSSVKAKEE
jgi:hypothetical protein